LERSTWLDQNELLASLLGAGARARLEPHLRPARLQQGQVLAEALEPMSQVYFPYSGIISFLVPLKDGCLVQTGVVGRDGAIGALQALDGKVSPNRVIVQVPGRAAVVQAERLAEIAGDYPTLRSLILSHEQFFFSEVQQSAACNAVHSIQQRVCRWILRMNDLVGMNVAITQELMAGIIGVKRTSVSAVAASLQAAGIIKYRRGHIQIVDIESVRQSSCECYQAIKDYRDICEGSAPRVTHATRDGVGCRKLIDGTKN
jgi:CRP-like cAMP-binding protein